jgi:hypothetical protein
MEIAALTWKVRAENSERRGEELEHALNLLINNSVDWFARFETLDEACHEFGIGVARSVPIEDPIRRAVQSSEVEDIALIFWRTTWPQGHKYISVRTPDGWARYRNALDTADPKPESTDQMSDMIGRALSEWKQAFERYMGENSKHSVLSLVH